MSVRQSLGSDRLIALSVAAVLLLTIARPLAGAETRGWWERYSALPAHALPGDRLLDAYFAERTNAIAASTLADIKTARDWQDHRDGYRRELAEMLGLWPWPERTDLHATVTGTLDNPAFTVEKLHLQSMPGLYVTADLYVPKDRKGKLPTIVYVCGHSRVEEKGVSLGNKTAYQHHPEWFARNGYVCIAIDTLQLGEIEGTHHGLYRENRWWWLNRGYTPAGVEAWNVIRTLDYLQTRPEVDATRFGITGRSGGGAYSWYASALDDRIKVAVPVAGITDLHNHVIDGCVLGHCDCMFMVNTYRWDFTKLAALVSPRPLLLGNSDKDAIFPIDGIERLHREVRRIYRLQGADEKFGMVITDGPHQDTQDLQVPVFRWFNRWLKNDTGSVERAEKLFEPRQLKVFDTLPTDQKNTRIDESFVPKAAEPTVPADAAAWAIQRDAVLQSLQKQTFAAWPADDAAVSLKPVRESRTDGLWLRSFELVTQSQVPLRLNVISADTPEQKLVVLNVVEQNDWPADSSKGLSLKSMAPKSEQKDLESFRKMLGAKPWAMAYLAVRGVGPTAWSGDEKRLIGLRRRFALLGETLDGMRAWDVRQAIRQLPHVEGLGQADVWVQGSERMAGIALFASLFEPQVKRLDLYRLPPTLDLTKDGPEFLNVLKTCDVPAAVAMAAEHAQVRLYSAAAKEGRQTWQYPIGVASRLGWGDDRVQVRTTSE